MSQYHKATFCLKHYNTLKSKSDVKSQSDEMDYRNYIFYPNYCYDNARSLSAGDTGILGSRTRIRVFVAALQRQLYLEVGIQLFARLQNESVTGFA